jgi:hypothetical protein
MDLILYYTRFFLLLNLSPPIPSSHAFLSEIGLFSIKCTIPTQFTRQVRTLSTTKHTFQLAQRITFTNIYPIFSTEPSLAKLHKHTSTPESNTQPRTQQIRRTTSRTRETTSRRDIFASRYRSRFSGCSSYTTSF